MTLINSEQKRKEVIEFIKNNPKSTYKQLKQAIITQKQKIEQDKKQLKQQLDLEKLNKRSREYIKEYNKINPHIKAWRGILNSAMR